MRFYADFHLHSKYSRACSHVMDIPHLVKYGKMKGLNLYGTGDFTHPQWFEHLKETLRGGENGIYERDGVKFVVSGEISLIYSQGGKVRKNHLLVILPSLGAASQVRDMLGKIGNLKADGRPILGMNSIDFTEKVIELVPDAMIVPAHCLPDSENILTDIGVRSIKKISKGNKVLSHSGKFRKVIDVFKRKYTGKLRHIIPFYFTMGIKTTPEHPFLAIKTYKKCSWTKGTCREKCSKLKECKNKYYLEYKPEWVPCKELEVGDVILFPRITKIKDKKIIKISDTSPGIVKNDKIRLDNSNAKSINNVIRVDTEFCRFIGYFLAEGSIMKDGISLTFSAKEKEYIKDVELLIKKIFGIEINKKRIKGNSCEIIIFSKVLKKFLHKLLYKNGQKSPNKSLPHELILLPYNKIKQIFLGWWRGDKGYTSSRELANAMKIICLKLGIIPSIRIDSAEAHTKRGNHVFEGRIIEAKQDSLHFSNLSFHEESLDLLEDPVFRKFKTKRNTRHGWVDTNHVYLPILKIQDEEFNGLVYNLEVEKDNSYCSEFACVHNCWTPWFSMFGSMSGFDSMKDCFQDQLKHIFAVETGLSSDPAMNWRVKQLDNMTLLSNSDAHSPWPHRVGREANVFEFKDLTYQSLYNTIKRKDREKFLFTIETDPAYGKYHWDGHRGCGVSMPPAESKKLNKICPKCHSRLTIGVEHRIEELADRPKGFKLEGAIPFRNLLPLAEIISKAIGKGVGTKTVWSAYEKAVRELGMEYGILLDVPKHELSKVLGDDVAKAVLMVRENKVRIKPGFDGVYGEADFGQKHEKTVSSKPAQKGLNTWL